MTSFQEDVQLSTDLRTVVTRLWKKLRSQSPTHQTLSLTEQSVIKHLNEHTQLLPTELAKLERVTTQSMSQILNHLSVLGYITRRPLEKDKRKVMIALSETGLTVLHTVRNEVDEWLSHALQETCTPDEREIIRQALSPLTKLLHIA